MPNLKRTPQRPAIAAAAILGFLIVYVLNLRCAHIDLYGSFPRPGSAKSTLKIAAITNRSAECAKGVFLGSRRQFWDYHDDQSPGLTEVIHAEDRVYVVLSTKLPEPFRAHWTAGNQGNWTFEFAPIPQLNFPGTKVQAHSLGKDAHGHTLTVHALLPKLLLAHSQHAAERMHVEVKHGNLTRRYEHVPLCVSPSNSSEFKHLVACTEIMRTFARLVPEWAAYHSLQGFQHMYIYVNDDVAAVRQHLQPLEDAGLITLVDWEWPQRYYGKLQFQQAEQNGCLVHSRGRARWVGLHDVDEFFQVMVPGNQTVAEFLYAHSELEHFGTLVAKSVWWGRSANASEQSAWTNTSQELVLKQYQMRSNCCEGKMRQKMLANPRGASYNSVHHITTGGQEHAFDGETQLRLNHFKMPDTNSMFILPDTNYSVHDPSLSQHGTEVLQLLNRLGFTV